MTQEHEAHIHVADYNIKNEQRMALLAAALIENFNISQWIHNITTREKPRKEDPRTLRRLHEDLRRNQSMEARPLVVDLLTSHGIKATRTVIPCPGFGQAGHHQFGRICLSWASADTGEAFADLWLHAVQFHAAREDENATHDLTLDVACMFRTHRFLEQGVRL